MNLDLPTSARYRSAAVLPLRQRAEVTTRILRERLDNLLPALMRETGYDMWLVLCQEDDYDPVFRTLMHFDSWCPILQMLVFFDRGEAGLERINLSMTRTPPGLYERPWTGTNHEELWTVLRQIIEERDPQRIGINIGSVQWAAGGLTHNLYNQLVQALPQRYVERLVSAEPLVTRWLAALSEGEIELYRHVVSVAHALLAECYSRAVIVPGVTTSDDLEWHYWQRVADLGLEVSFKPFFNIVRSKRRWDELGGLRVIHPGDMIHSDVGIRYLGLISDNQEWAYILRPGEGDAPEEYRRLLAEGNRLQDIYLAEFREGLTGNELLSNILRRAQREGIGYPKVYSHSLGHCLHEPGPLIGLPWEQENCPGRGDVPLRENYAFTMELSAGAELAAWGGELLRMSLEEDVVYTREGCRLIDGRQDQFYLV